MKRLNNTKIYVVNNEIEDTLKLIQYNIENTNKMIFCIDKLIEKKNLPDYLLQTLIALRDIYSINSMNLERFICCE